MVISSRIKKTAASLLLALSVFTSIYADGIIRHSVLPNGLEVFITKNNAAPLVYIEIAVKAGGITQTPQNAGLFHLYEHMLFKGNTKFPTAAAVQRALSDMGVTSWNGSTAHEYINYYFTVPSSKLREGLEFWSYAVREPLLDETELENEKKVVISEITGGFAEPGRIYSHAVNVLLFPDRPWKLDPAGTVENVQNCSSADLKQMQKTYYVPENSAVFIGGAVDPDEALALAEEIYGSWQPAQPVRTRVYTASKPNKPSASNKQSHSAADFSFEPRFYVYPTEMVSPAAARADIFFRGPDTAYDTESTYAADIWSSLVSAPSGRFLQALINHKELGIPSPDYAGAGYLTRRESGRISFSAFMIHPENSIAERTAELTRTITQQEIPAMIEDSSYFSENEIASVKQRIIDSSVFDTETAEGLLSMLRFWWASSSADYFFLYEDNTIKTQRADISSFIQSYMNGIQPVTTVMVHPSVYEKNKASFEKNGFTVITADNAFWWKNDSSLQPVKNAQKNIADSAGRTVLANQTAIDKRDTSVKTVYLSNNIPVFLYNSDDSRINNIRIGITGGVPLIDKTKAGVEDALLSMMSRGSQTYPHQKVRDWTYSTQTSFGSASFNDYSYISAAGIDSYFLESVRMITAGFLNPSFDEQEFSRLMLEYKQNLQQRSSDPVSILVDAVRKEMYSGHPYETAAAPDEFTVDTLTISDLKKHHALILDPSRIVISAAGNFSTEELLTILDSTLGHLPKKQSLPGKRNTVHKTKIPELTFNSKNTALTSPTAQGTGYYAAVFPYPSLYDGDYIAAAVAAAVYDDILFNIVREKYGACYSIGNDAAVSRVSYGMTAAVKVSDLQNIEQYIGEAFDILKQNMIIDGKDEKTGAFRFIPLSERIESYKNTFINSYFNSLRTNSEISSRMISGYIYHNDPEYFKKTANRIEKVTAKDVHTAFIKYWNNDEKLVFTVTGGK